MILTARTPHNWNIKTVNSCTIPLSPIHTVCACKSARWDARDGLVSRKWLQWILSGILGKLNRMKAAENNVSHSLATWHNYQNWNLILRENIYQTKAFAICLREEMLNSRRAPSVSTSQSANASAMHEFEWKTDLKTSAIDWHDTAVGSQLFVNVFRERRRWSEKRNEKNNNTTIDPFVLLDVQSGA